MKYPKETMITHIPSLVYSSSYICPYCKSNINGAGINLVTTRFRCSQCHKEVRVSSHNILQYGNRH